MNIGFDSLFNYLKYFWPRRKTKHGLLLIIIFIIIIFFVLPPFKTVNMNLKIILSISSILLYIILWTFFSGRKRLPNKKINVAIALKSLNTETQLIINKTILYVKDQLKKLSIYNKFKIHEIGTDINRSSEEAERYIGKRKINLLIHGNVYSGNVDNVYTYDLKNFFISFNILNSSENVLDLIRNDILQFLKGRDWTVASSNELIDVEKVSRNLVEVILSSIAISICQSYENTSTSIILLEKLIPFVKNRLNEKEKKFRIRANQTKILIPLNVFRYGRLLNILYFCYNYLGDQYLRNGEYRETITIMKKSLDFGIDNIKCLSVLAVAHYYLKDIDAAKHYTKEINRQYPRNIHYYLNMAFFSLLENDYTKMLRYYCSLKSKVNKKNKYIIESAVLFFEKNLNDIDNTAGVKFALAYLNFNYLDVKKGIELLTDFQNYAKSENSLTLLLNESIKLLKKTRKKS